MTIYRPDDLLENDIDQMVGEPRYFVPSQWHIYHVNHTVIWSWDDNGVAWREYKTNEGNMVSIDKCGDNTYTPEDAETTINEHLVIKRAVHRFPDDHNNDDIETKD